MKQILLSGKGAVQSLELPSPERLEGAVLVRNHYSVISGGTEGAALSKRSGTLGLAEKILKSTDRAKQVLELTRKEGITKTANLVSGKLSGFSPIGYSSAGEVIEVGPDSKYRIGDRVACMGAGFANHAEIVCVPEQLTCPIPDGVKLQHAAFGTIACIAQHGIRVLNLSPGETVVIIGLGLIGELALLQAQAMGYQALGIDLSAERVAHAHNGSGAACFTTDDEQLVEKVLQVTAGYGADGVVICAGTKSSDPVNLAFDLCRKGGKVSVVGDIGLELQRDKMYKKELQLLLSCSYGPGRYDPLYELQGMDYPLEFCRWTENRNLGYFLSLLGRNHISLEPLISEIFSPEEAQKAYACLKSTEKASYGVLFDFSPQETNDKGENQQSRVLEMSTSKKKGVVRQDTLGLGIIGHGGFSDAVLLPNLIKLEKYFTMQALCGRSGVRATVSAKRHGIPLVTTDYRRLLDRQDIDAVVIATRHREHAPMVLDALDAGKHVFVEKPMCLTIEEGEQIMGAVEKTGLTLRVGFNRRFAPMINELKNCLQGPRIFSIRVNIGRDQLTHWSNDASEGGRFVGEGVHFIDLARYFMEGEELREHQLNFLGAPGPCNPNISMTLSFSGGSLAHILYTTEGNPKMGKEYFEAFAGGVSGIVDDFQSLQISGRRHKVTGKGDKGHFSELEEFGATILGHDYPIKGANAYDGYLATKLARVELPPSQSKRIIG